MSDNLRGDFFDSHAVRPPCRCSDYFQCPEVWSRDATTPKLHWLRVPERITFKLASLVFRCLNGTAPVYLADSINRTDVVEMRRSLRLHSSSLTAVDVPVTCRSTIGDRFIKFIWRHSNIWRHNNWCQTGLQGGKPALTEALNTIKDDGCAPSWIFEDCSINCGGVRDDHHHQRRFIIIRPPIKCLPDEYLPVRIRPRGEFLHRKSPGEFLHSKMPPGGGLKILLHYENEKSAYPIYNSLPEWNLSPSKQRCRWRFCFKRY